MAYLTNNTENSYNNETKNLVYIDIAKFIAIFLVVLGHLLQTSYLYNVIYTFHMPLFFVISGILFKKKDKEYQFNKLYYGLFTPLFIYTLISFPFRLISYTIITKEPVLPTFIKMTLGGILCSTVDTTHVLFVFASWFLLCTIFLRLIFFYLNYTAKNLIILNLISLICIYFIVTKHIILYFAIASTFMAIPFFTLGICLKNFLNNNYEKKYSKIESFGLATLFFTLLFTIVKYNSGIINYAFPWIKIGNPSLILTYIAGLTGVLATIFFAKIFNYDSPFINKISKNTLFIYFFHIIIRYILQLFKITKWIHGINNFALQIFLLFILTVIILLISLYIVKIIEDKNLLILLGKYNPQKTQQVG